MDNIKGSIDISAELERYSTEIAEEISELAKELGAEGKQKLKEKSPKKTGKYSKSWSVRVDRSKGKIDVVLYNAKYYNLTHLLEKGHPLRSGGRARAFPHIKPVEEELNDKFLKGVENILENK